MTIDTHQHFWKYDPVRDTWIDDTMEILKRDFMPVDLSPILNQNGVNGCIAVQADQSEDENLFLLDLANKNNFIKAVVGWVDLRDDNLEEKLDYYNNFLKFKGVRHIVQAEKKGFMLDEKFLNGIGQLAQYGLIYEVLIRKDQLEEATQMIAQFPNQTFVLDHMAKPDIKGKEIEPWAQQIRKLATFNNVFCKVSGMVTEADWRHHKYEDFEPYLNIVFEAFGVDRLMYGSDWPVCLLAESYSGVMDIVRRFLSTFTTEEQAKIMGSNAMKVYGFQ